MIRTMLSRRKWLQRGAAAGAGLVLGGCTTRKFSGPGPFVLAGDTERWALLSDPHVCGEAGKRFLGTNMAEHVRRAVDEVTRSRADYAGAIVAGDCAFRRGEPGDYQMFDELLGNPVRQAGVPLHLMVGNHDQRDRFESAMRVSAGPAGRCVSVVRSRYANWFLLDSLDRTNQRRGRVGAEQVQWLDEALTAEDAKPAIVVAHHSLDKAPQVPGFAVGMRDGRDVWAILRRHPHVKAFIYGHTHRWDVRRDDGIYLVNLPTTAFLLQPRQPQAWVDAVLRRDRIQLRLKPVNGARGDLYGRVTTLRWA